MKPSARIRRLQARQASPRNEAEFADDGLDHLSADELRQLEEDEADALADFADSETEQ